MNRLLLPLVAALSLSSCVTYHSAGDGLVRAKLSETATLSGTRITPLKVLEDSRCPIGVQCIWAGQVRLSVMIDTNGGSETRELIDGHPVSAMGGTLELAEVMPAKRKDMTIYPEDYRFGLRFTR